MTATPPADREGGAACNSPEVMRAMKAALKRLDNLSDEDLQKRLAAPVGDVGQWLMDMHPESAPESMVGKADKLLGDWNKCNVESRTAYGMVSLHDIFMDLYSECKRLEALPASPLSPRCHALIEFFTARGFNILPYMDRTMGGYFEVHLTKTGALSIHAKSSTYEEALEFAYSTLLQRTP